MTLSTSPSTLTSSPLLLLPRELRNKIYHALLYPSFTTERHRSRPLPASNFRTSSLYFDVSSPSPTYTPQPRTRAKTPATTPRSILRRPLPDPPLPPSSRYYTPNPPLPPSPPTRPSDYAQTVAALLSTAPFAPILGVCRQVTAEVIEELVSWLGNDRKAQQQKHAQLRWRAPLTLHACNVMSSADGHSFEANMLLVELVLQDLLPGVKVLVVEVGRKEDGVETVCQCLRYWAGGELYDCAVTLGVGEEEVLRVSVYEDYLRPRDGGEAMHLYGRLGVFSRLEVKERNVGVAQ